MSGPLRPGDTLRFEFSLQDGDGAAVNGDSLPTAALYRNGTADGAVTVTVNAAVATGAYNGSCTVPSGYAAGDEVAVLVVAVVAAVTARIWAEREILVQWPATALPNAASGAAGAVLTAGTGTAQLAVSGGAATTVTTTTNLTNLPSIPANWITAAGITAGALNGKGDWNTTTPPTVSAIAAGVWDLATTGHTTSGTFGAAMVAAGSAGDPWGTTLPGAYGAGTAGNILGNNLDAAVSSRLATAGYTAPDNTGIGTAATNSATILNRIGAFTGSGVNTILGFFKALLSNAASTPSDVGGTFDPATDSVEAIRDRGDAAWITATSVTVSDKTGFSLGAAGLAMFFTTDTTKLYADAVAGSVVKETASNAAGGGGGGPTAADVADAVWDEARGDHVAAGSFGEHVPADVVKIKNSAEAATLQAAAARAVYSGTVTGAPTTTSFRDSALGGDPDAYRGRVVVFTSGAIDRQASTIDTFDPVTHEITVNALQPFTQAATIDDTWNML